MDKLSFLKGLALGLAGKPLEFAPEQPTAFFYGHVAKEGETPTHIFDGVDYVGVVLPKLPEWDKTVYPYAVLWKDTFNNGTFDYRITPIEKIMYYNATTGWAVQTTALTKINYTLTDNMWQSNNLIPYGVRLEQMIWANFDVLNKNGSVYLAASDPIPIYE